MATYIMLTRIAPGALKGPSELETLEKDLMGHIRRECPQVKWLANYAVLGPWDYVDVFEAPDPDTAVKVSALVRTHGRARTETWPAAEWRRFKDLVHHLG